MNDTEEKDNEIEGDDFEIPIEKDPKYSKDDGRGPQLSCEDEEDTKEDECGTNGNKS